MTKKKGNPMVTDTQQPVTGADPVVPDETTKPDAPEVQPTPPPADLIVEAATPESVAPTDVIPEPVPEIDPRQAVSAAYVTAQQAAQGALETLNLLDQRLTGLVAAATAEQLDPKLHSAEHIEASYRMAIDAFLARQQQRTLLVMTWFELDQLTQRRLQIERDALLTERAKLES